MSAIVIAAAMLCGVPAGFIAGVIVGARMFRQVHPKDEPDYSGGV